MTLAFFLLQLRFVKFNALLDGALGELRTRVAWRREEPPLSVTLFRRDKRRPR